MQDKRDILHYTNVDQVDYFEITRSLNFNVMNILAKIIAIHVTQQ